MKRKTNISVQDNRGIRVTSSLIVGRTSEGFISGDILDANATLELVTDKVNDLIGGAGDALDTLKELGDSIPTKVSDLRNDAGYVAASEMPSYLASYLPLAGGTMTGDITAKSITLDGISALTTSNGYAVQAGLVTTNGVVGGTTAQGVKIGNSNYPLQFVTPDNSDIYRAGKTYFYKMWDSKNLANPESSTNKVTSLTPLSTDTQYPSAKAVYDQIAALSAQLSQLYTTQNYAVGDVLFSDGTISADVEDMMDAGKTPIAVCVAPASEFEDNKARFASLKITASNVVWGPSDTDTSLTNYTSDTDVKNDKDGANNTQQLIALGRSYSAAKACADLTLGGKQWYLPALGELYYMYTNYNTISAVLGRISTKSSSSVDNIYDYEYWTSNEYDSGSAWNLFLHASCGCFGECFIDDKFKAISVLAFVAIPTTSCIISNLLSRISALESASQGSGSGSCGCGCGCGSSDGVVVGSVLYSDGTVGDASLASSKTPVGICVAPASEFSDNKARFMSVSLITKDNNTNSTVMRWENSGCGCGGDFTETGLTNYSNELDVKADKNGASNTNTLLALDADFDVAQACHDYAPGTHDGEWYLPALGELYYVYTNYSTISSVLSNLGIITNKFAYNSWCWSSSLFNSDLAWDLDLYSSSDSFGACDGFNKHESNPVLAFVAF